jgi:hypothetical protein
VVSCLRFEESFCSHLHGQAVQRQVLPFLDTKQKVCTNIRNVGIIYQVTQRNNIPRGQNLQADINSCDKFKTIYSKHKQREPNRKRALDSVGSRITHWTLTKVRTVPLSRFHSMKGTNRQEKRDPRVLKIGMVWTKALLIRRPPDLQRGKKTVYFNFPAWTRTDVFQRSRVP